MRASWIFADRAVFYSMSDETPRNIPALLGSQHLGTELQRCRRSFTELPKRGDNLEQATTDPARQLTPYDVEKYHVSTKASSFFKREITPTPLPLGLEVDLSIKVELHLPCVFQPPATLGLEGASQASL
jgi:hypothetical protein